MSAGEWCLIESDPGVFSELIRGFGVSSAQVEELYSLDDEAFAPLKPIHGLVFLFKWESTEESKPSDGALVQDSRLDDMFFAKQVIQNACATQAILNLILNITGPNVKLGEELSVFKDFTKSFDPQTTGLAISNSEQLRKVHNSFSRHQVFEFEEKLANKSEDLFHFVGYMPINGRLYELDGLREGPLDHGAVESGPDAWLARAREVIQARIDKYAGKEIRFNLMAIISDKRERYESQIQQLQTEIDTATAQDGAATSDEQLIEMARLNSLLEEEQAKLTKARQDNVMANQGKLTEFYEHAKTRTLELNKATESMSE